MARIRMIKPEFFDDPQLAELPPIARLLFIGLWTQADRDGRLIDEPRRLKARLFPFDDMDIDDLLTQLSSKDVIRRYTSADDKNFIWIRSFVKHQRPHPKEPASVIPKWSDAAAKKRGEPRKNTASNQSNGTRNLDSGTRNLGEGSLTSTNQLARSDLRSSSQTTTKTDFGPSVSNRLIFKGQRFVILEWMLDNFTQMLGPHLETFNLDEWFYALDAKAISMAVIIDKKKTWDWLHTEFLAELDRRKIQRVGAKQSDEDAAAELLTAIQERDKRLGRKHA